MPNTDKYTIRLDITKAEWAKQHGGLSELVRRCLDAAYSAAHSPPASPPPDPPAG